MQNLIFNINQNALLSGNFKKNFETIFHKNSKTLSFSWDEKKSELYPQLNILCFHPWHVTQSHLALVCKMGIVIIAMPILAPS